MSNDVNMINTLRKRGFAPNSIIDGGASVGNWTKAIHNIFPQAQFLMIEPREGCRAHLERIQSKHVQYTRALLYAHRIELPFYEQGEMSSIFDIGKTDNEVSTIETETLDNLAYDMSGPILLKLDLQGAEMDALVGAKEILPNVEVIFMEVSLFPFMAGLPTIENVIPAMDVFGYMVYDIFNKHTRLIDNRVGQLDICFVAKTSQLVADNRWSKEW